MQKNKLIKITALVIFLILILTSVVQAVVTIRRNIIIPPFDEGSKGYSSWEDYFNDSTKIDPSPPGVGATDNYIIESGQVKMKNTYSIWTESSWTRMKPIQVTNNAGSPITNCVFKIIVSYDSDMQSDYDDIRFKHESVASSWLDYWIETYDSTEVVVWVEIPYLQTGTSNMYLFYGNPTATSQSNFDNVFSWEYNWVNDYKISNKNDNAGAWDPDVEYGNDRFFVSWEQGTAQVGIYYQEIKGKIFDTNGNVVVSEFVVFKDNVPILQYRNENPSMAFGGGKFFVAWEHYDVGSASDPTTLNIKGRTVTPSGSMGSVIDICTATNCQADANVQFDSVNNRFCVVWEDARNGINDYNIYGRLYDTSGSPVGSEKIITSAINSQCEPWVAFDPTHQRYMIIWEDGETPNLGPFDIYVGLFDKDLNALNTPIKLADGNADVDYNFPCVEYCVSTQNFLATWNDGDISDGDWFGNVWAAVLNAAGSVVVSAFQISSGNYVRTDIMPYLDTLFFVTYGDYSKIYGRVVSSNGTVISNNILVSVGGTADADWANAATYANKIFVSWEDERITSSLLPDTYCNILNQYLPGSSITTVIGTEKEIVLNSHITSIKIEPVNLIFWDRFNEISTRGDIVFDILNGDTGALIVSDISTGYNLSAISAPSIRLKATFTRTDPSSTPALDMWSVSYYTNEAPNTPSAPFPPNGATNVNLNVDLSWSGGDPNGDVVTYDVYLGTTSSPPLVIANQSGTIYDPGTLIFNTTYYWKIVAWDVYGAMKAGPLWSFTTRINHPPNTPSAPNPAHGTVNVNINADLSWTGGDPDPGDVVTYDIYFGTTSPPPILVYGHTTTTYDPGAMYQNTLYYWKIVAWDSFGLSSTGPIWNFTTESNSPPNIPSAPNPANGATNVAIDTGLSWIGGDPDGDPVTYNVFFGTTNPPPKVSDNQSTTSYDPPGDLVFSTTYYWKIVSYDNQGAYTIGPLWSFTTKANSPPTTPSAPNPANHATDVSVNIILTWSCSDPDGDDLTYNVFLGKTSPPPKVSDNQSSNSYDPPGALDFSTTYYWQIVAYDEYGASSVGTVWDFTTKANAPPNIWGRNPDNESTAVDTNADLSWQASDPDGDLVTFDVYFGETTPPVQVVSNQTETTFDPGKMNSNTTYYWKLVAWDDKGASKEEPIWWFKTKEETNTPPNAPTIYCEGVIINLFVFIKPNIEYEFDFVSSDSNQDDIYYFIDWGDGTSSDWLGPFPTSEHILVKHTWSSNLKFGSIKAKVKDIHDAESGVTSLFYLTIKNRNSPINNIFERFLQRFNINNGFFRPLLLLIITLFKANNKVLNI